MSSPVLPEYTQISPFPPEGAAAIISEKPSSSTSANCSTCDPSPFSCSGSPSIRNMTGPWDIPGSSEHEANNPNGPMIEIRRTHVEKTDFDFMSICSDSFFSMGQSRIYAGEHEVRPYGRVILGAATSFPETASGVENRDPIFPDRETMKARWSCHHVPSWAGHGRCQAIDPISAG
jgi:hypothetical protein